MQERIASVVNQRPVNQMPQEEPSLPCGVWCRPRKHGIEWGRQLPVRLASIHDSNTTKIKVGGNCPCRDQVHGTRRKYSRRVSNSRRILDVSRDCKLMAWWVRLGCCSSGGGTGSGSGKELELQKSRAAHALMHPCSCHHQHRFCPNTSCPWQHHGPVEA